MALIDLDAIQAVANRIAEQFRPDKIILFGSYAYGNPNEDSDVDLLVIMPLGAASWLDRVMEIKRAIRPIRRFPLDIMVKAPEEVAYRYSGFDPLIRWALDDGKVLYNVS